jgi:hypothetical protein
MGAPLAVHRLQRTEDVPISMARISGVSLAIVVGGW